MERWSGKVQVWRVDVGGCCYSRRTSDRIERCPALLIDRRRRRSAGKNGSFRTVTNRRPPSLRLGGRRRPSAKSPATPAPRHHFKARPRPLYCCVGRPVQPRADRARRRFEGRGALFRLAYKGQKPPPPFSHLLPTFLLLQLLSPIGFPFFYYPWGASFVHTDGVSQIWFRVEGSLLDER